MTSLDVFFFFISESRSSLLTIFLVDGFQY